MHQIISVPGSSGRALRVVESSAQVLTFQSWKGSLVGNFNRAFGILFEYISGANKAAEEIPMTAPVVQSQDAARIPMTAPVLQTHEGTGLWETAFVLPEGYTAKSAPKPNDERVTLRDVPARTVAVTRFTGWVSEEDIEEHTQKLREWIAKNSYSASSAPHVARYDPPFALPFFRRNEIHITVKKSPAP